MLSITLTFDFTAKHHINLRKFPENTEHPHNYKLEVKFKREFIKNDLDYTKETDSLIKYSKFIHKKVIKKFNGKNLNDFYTYPTLEHFLKDITLTIRESFPEVIGVKLHESDKIYAEWERIEK